MNDKKLTRLNGRFDRKLDVKFRIMIWFREEATRGARGSNSSPPPPTSRISFGDSTISYKFGKISEIGTIQVEPLFNIFLPPIYYEPREEKIWNELQVLTTSISSNIFKNCTRFQVCDYYRAENNIPEHIFWWYTRHEVCLI